VNIRVLLMIILYYLLGYAWLSAWNQTADMKKFLDEEKKRRKSDPLWVASYNLALIIIVTIWIPLFLYDIYQFSNNFLKRHSK